MIDPLTVSLTTNKPYATLVIDTPWPIATEYFNSVGDAKFKTNPVAAGPWKFVSQELNSNVKYERHEDYFDPARKPNWKKLVYAIVPDESSRVAGIQTGALDIAFGLTASSADALKGDSKVKINENPGTGLCYCMMYDNAIADVDSPLKDLRVRKALLMAVDRDSIAKTLYKGFAKTPTSAMPTVTMGFNPDTQAVPYDADGAKQLLADAGPLGPVVDPQHVRGHVDGARHPEAGGDDHRLLVGGRCRFHAQRRRRGHLPAPVPQQAAQGGRPDRRPDERATSNRRAWARHRSSGRRPRTRPSSATPSSTVTSTS